MTPYGYHQSETARGGGDERKIMREAMREAKLARQRASDEAAAAAAEPSIPQPSWIHRILDAAPRLHLRAHSR